MNTLKVAAFATSTMLAVYASSASAQAAPARKDTAHARDSAYAALQERGKHAMGVDQYTSTHTFDSYPDGGRVALVRDSDDSAGVAQIRRHLRDIKKAFEAGDFSTPEFVHMREVPGTKIMAARRTAITYEVHDIPRGAELRIRSTDAEVVKAIHEFMSFQRMDHHAGGHGDHGGHGG